MAAHYIGGASQFRTRPRVLDGFVAYANLGAPLSAGAFAHDLSPLEFAAAAARWRDANAAWIGGCCGTTPAHVAAIASLP